MKVPDGPLNRRERKAAVKAWRKIPTDTRSETVRLARKGQTHPDEGIAEIAAIWSRSVVEGPWYGQVGGWPVILIGLAITTFSVVNGAIFLWLAGVVVIIAGFLGLNQRNVARRILAADRGGGD